MSDTRKEVFKNIHERCFQFGSCNYKETGCSDCPINVILVKAETLLDKQEQGLLIELPCKVGDVVYRFCGTKGRKYVDIRYVNNITYRLDYKGDVVWEIFTTTNDVLGKTVFLTHSEAEEALAKMGGANE